MGCACIAMLLKREGRITVVITISNRIIPGVMNGIWLLPREKSLKVSCPDKSSSAKDTPLDPGTPVISLMVVQV